jgi:hypothetical protein
MSEIVSECKHLLILDGLDDILTSREAQYVSLGALIFEANRLNQFFRNNGVQAKILIVCRTDLFERINGANKNKVRQDYSTELDWYHNTRNPEDSRLIEIANLRASRSLKCKVDIFDKFFPRKIGRGQDVRVFLLEMTRHTPRDFIQLLHYIQGYSGDHSVSEDAIKSGSRAYSISYFLPEIKDELSGYFPGNEIATIFEWIGRTKQREFALADIFKIADQNNSDIDQDKITRFFGALFYCSAIGNIKHKQGGTTYYTFNYRNRHSHFNRAERIILHRGLWKALNLI